MFKYCLWSGVPAFFWIRGLKSALIRKALIAAIRDRQSNMNTTAMMIIACFLGKATYKESFNSLGAYGQRLAPAMQKFPEFGPRRVFGTLYQSKNDSKESFREEKLIDLNKIVERGGEDEGKPNTAQRAIASKLDCYLFAQDDKYM
jgi:hypothetical protein